VSDQTVSLESMARLISDLQSDIRGFRTEMVEFRGQMTAQTEILQRLEASQNTMAEELRTVASQHQRTDRRLLALVERLGAFEGR
jgi:chromosome segregation ATPase